MLCLLSVLLKAQSANLSAPVIHTTAQLFQRNVTRAAMADRDDKENWLAQITDWGNQHLTTQAPAQLAEALTNSIKIS